MLTGLVAVSLLAISLFKGSPAPEVASVDRQPEAALPAKAAEDQSGLLLLPAKDELKMDVQQQQDAISIIKNLDFSINASLQTKRDKITLPAGENALSKSEPGQLATNSAYINRQVVSEPKENIPTDVSSDLSEVMSGTNNQTEAQLAVNYERNNLQGVDGFGAEKQRQYIFEGVWVSRSDLVDFLPAEKVYCKDFVRFISCWSVPEYTNSTAGSFKNTTESRLSGFTDKGAFTVTSNVRTTKLPAGSAAQAQQLAALPAAETSITKSKRCVFIDHNFISCSAEGGHIERYSRIARN